MLEDERVALETVEKGAENTDQNMMQLADGAVGRQSTSPVHYAVFQPVLFTEADKPTSPADPALHATMAIPSRTATHSDGK